MYVLPLSENTMNLRKTRVFKRYSDAFVFNSWYRYTVHSVLQCFSYYRGIACKVTYTAAKEDVLAAGDLVMCRYTMIIEGLDRVGGQVYIHTYIHLFIHTLIQYIRVSPHGHLLQINRYIHTYILCIHSILIHIHTCMHFCIQGWRL